MRKFIIKVNGNRYEVEVEEVTDGETTPERPASTIENKPAPEPSHKKVVEEKPKDEKEVVRWKGQRW